MLTECLPNKCEYVIMVRMSEIQGMLYQYYIENYAQGKKRSKRNERSLLLVDYNELRNVWSHPKALTLTNNESEEFTSDSEDETEKQPQRNSSNQSFSRSLRSDVPWWTDLVSSSHGEFDAIEKSGKMLVLFDIIRFCEQIGEKLVVFCQSAVTLDVVEFFLAKEDEKRQVAFVLSC